MITVKRLLEKKENAIWSISPHAMVYEALSLMAEKNIGAVLVIEREILVGILSERDYARKIILKGKRSIDTQVWEIMTSDVIFVNPDQSIEECMAIMTEKHVRHLPVISDEVLVGLVSIGDVVKELISEKQFVIEQLENYIAGR